MRSRARSTAGSDRKSLAGTAAAVSAPPTVGDPPPPVAEMWITRGLRVWVPEIFDDMPWSTSQVCALTLQRLAQHTVHVGPVLHDIDEPADLQHLPLHWSQEHQHVIP